MEASRAASHVEFFAKACTAILEVYGTGRYRANKTGSALQSHSLTAYYFGHVLKCNFFFANGIENLHFPLIPRERTNRSAGEESQTTKQAFTG